MEWVDEGTEDREEFVLDRAMRNSTALLVAQRDKKGIETQPFYCPYLPFLARRPDHSWFKTTEEDMSWLDGDRLVVITGAVLYTQAGSSPCHILVERRPRRPVDTEAGKDFFISYTSADKKWAEWIAWQLEEVQYSTILQAWDFQPGMNFVLEMDKAAREARYIIVVLSPGYLSAHYTQPEWAVAFRRDPQSEKGALLPVRVQKCEVEGLLGPIVYIDLVDLDETTAREVLLAGVRRERGKPDTEPGFPGGGQHTIPEPQRFPGVLPPILNVPYRRNPFFTGREDVLNQLHEHFIQAKTAALTQPPAITGLGGIGKTQVAVEYAYRHIDIYRYILWVNAATRDTLITSFLDLARLFNLPEKDEQDQNIMIQAVKRWLEQHDQWLLIFDNADDLTLAEDFLPTGGKGHILLTTRAQAPGALANGIDIEKMGAEEGTLLLLRRAKVLAIDVLPAHAPAREWAAAKSIVKEMDGLPLALDQAGAYIEETQCSISDYLTIYHQRQAELLKRRGGTGKEYPEPIATTWLLSFENVKRLSPIAADLLIVCAFLAPDAIPEELLTKGASELGSHLQHLATDASQINDAIGILLRYSLIKRYTQEHMLSIHRLVQVVLKESMNEQTQRVWVERVVRAVSKVFPSGEFKTWSDCKRYLSHAQVCVDYIKQNKMASLEAAQLLNQTGYYLYKYGQYEQAQPLLELCLRIRKKVLGPEHAETARILTDLGRLYFAQGWYKRAEPLLCRALSIRKQVLGLNSNYTARAFNNLAELYRNQGKYQQAEPLYQQALAIYEQVSGAEHPDTARVINNLAELYKDQGKYAEAEPLYQRALAIREKQPLPEHPDTATTMHGLASLYQAQGRYAEVEPLYQRALTITEKQLGPEHPDTTKVRESYDAFVRDMKREGKGQH